MKQNKVLLNRMEKEFYSRKQALLMLLYKICEHCLSPNKEEKSIEEVKHTCCDKFVFLHYSLKIYNLKLKRTLIYR